MHRSSIACRALLLGILAAGCAAPQVAVKTRPTPASVFVDGRRVAKPARPVPMPYYGTAVISAREPARVDTGSQLIDARRELSIDAPFSPWLFPFDFLAEAVTYPWRGDRYDFAAELRLEQRPVIVPGFTPRHVDSLRHEAKRAMLER